MVGIDIVEIGRLKDVKKGDFMLWNKVFTESEWQYCFDKPLPLEHLAGIFAAKEAVMKAVGEKIMKQYTAIVVKHMKDGKPIIELSLPEALTVEISISHSKENAVAIALVKQ